MGQITHNGLIYIDTNDGFLGLGVGTLEYGNAAVLKTEISGKIVIPKRVEGKLVTTIQEYAFRECGKITEVEIKAPIVRIYHAAFYSCLRH